MPWQHRSIIGERLSLIQTLLRSHKSLRYWSASFGVSRKTAWKWKRRFLEEGRRGLQDRSRRPVRMPRGLAAVWIRRIQRLRQRQPDWGAKKIERQLRDYGRPPHIRTIARWLKRLGLTRTKPRRPRKACWQVHGALTGGRRPNEVWTVDFKGWFSTGNGQRCEPLTVRDLFSRYGLLVRLLPTQHWEPVQAEFIRLFRTRGLPEVIRVDNGGPFASKGPAGLSRLSVWWLRMGIRVEFTRPGHPEDNGSHEQI